MIEGFTLQAAAEGGQDDDDYGYGGFIDMIEQSKEGEHSGSEDSMNKYSEDEGESGEEEQSGDEEDEGMEYGDEEEDDEESRYNNEEYFESG